METTLPTYERRGLRHTYRAEGEGEPLLLLHAFPLSHRMWEPQLGSFSGSHRCLAPDFPGFGASDLPREGASRMQELATDAVALLDHLGISRAVVCGISMGGYVALALWERHPERVRGLVLADTRSGADAPEGRERRLALAERVLAEGPGFLAGEMPAKLLGASTLEQRPELRRTVAEWIAGARPEGVAAASRGMAERPDRTGLLARLSVPALIVVGEEDTLTPPQESRSMAERMPGAELVEIARAGHLSNLERPEAFDEALGRFLKRL
ncbi:MAG TPA: alpha/beta fold hydrolase [Thermoanaerobaculia bacterium]|nr:alpha/beta fold hydrolase [Thermoanaerobaculia bacterium]